MVLVGDPQISPDGSAIYYRRAWFDKDADEVRGAVRRVDRDGADRAFTGGTNDRLARVAPDGTSVAFVADRDGKTRLYLLRLDGGEAAPLAADYPKITAVAWSPDGKQVAFVATSAHDAANARVFHDAKSGARHIRMLPFKSDADGLLDGARKHLFVIDVAGGDARQLTRGDFDVAQPAWSPDGARIAFSARIDVDDPEGVTAISDIHVVDVASGERTRLTHGTGPMTVPAFSRDGKEIAFAGHHHGDDGGGRFDTELLVMPAGGGETRSLSAGLGRTIGDPVGGDLRTNAWSPPAWSANDREIIVQVCDEGSTSLRAFARDGSGSRIVAGGERQITNFTVANDGSIALAYGTPTVPNEIALLESYGGERSLTDANAWLVEKTVVGPKRYRPRADDGTVLDAWLIAPAASTEANPPLVLEVHGGPHAAYGNTFFLEFQVLAAQGIAVAYGNPRGSQSYGHAYANAILGDWGGIDVADVLRILDGALEHGELRHRAHRRRGRLVRRLHGDLAHGPQRPLRGGRVDARGQRLHQRDRRIRPRLVLGARAADQVRRRRGPQAVRKLADARGAVDRGAAAGGAQRTRFPLPDRSGRAALHHPAPPRPHGCGIRALHRHRPRDVAQRQAAQPHPAPARDRPLVHPPPQTCGRRSTTGGCRFAVRAAAGRRAAAMQTVRRYEAMRLRCIRFSSLLTLAAAAATTSGLISIVRNSTRAGWSGKARPCSHC